MLAQSISPRPGPSTGQRIDPLLASVLLDDLDAIADLEFALACRDTRRRSLGLHPGKRAGMMRRWLRTPAF